MGSILGKALEESARKQREGSIQMQEAMMERNILMQNCFREQITAMHLARARDMCMWYSSFYACTLVGLTAGFLKTRKSGLLVALVPLSFIEAYNLDLAYGSKIYRIRDNAYRILIEEPTLVDLPQGVPTVAMLDNMREAAK